MNAPKWTFLVLSAATGFAQDGIAQNWIQGEMGYRVSIVPAESPAARSQIRVTDVIADPATLPDRLLKSPPEGIDLAAFRFDATKMRYDPIRIHVAFREGEEKRLGLTGDIGFLVAGTQPGSLGARAELKPGDFLPKINETFVHSVADLHLVNDAFEKNEQVMIHFVRWIPEAHDFKTGYSRRRFVK